MLTDYFIIVGGKLCLLFNHIGLGPYHGQLYASKDKHKFATACYQIAPVRRRFLK